MTEAAVASAVRVARKPNLNFILVCVFIDMLGIGLAIPVLPILVGEFVEGRDLQAHWFGILAATFGLLQFLCMPILGAVSDRIGRRPVRPFSIAVRFLNLLSTACAPHLAGLVHRRGNGGLRSGDI